MDIETTNRAGVTRVWREIVWAPGYYVSSCGNMAYTDAKGKVRPLKVAKNTGWVFVDGCKMWVWDIRDEVWGYPRMPEKIVWPVRRFA